MAHETVRSAKVVSVIRTVSIRGAGFYNDPVREVVQFWSLVGDLLAEQDPACPQSLESTHADLSTEEVDALYRKVYDKYTKTP